MAKEKEPVNLKKEYDDAVYEIGILKYRLKEAEDKIKLLENTPPKTETKVVEKVVEVEAKEDKEMKLLVFRLLWQAHRMMRCATTKEITHLLPKLRKWVGETEAEELELKWRRG
jgi:hypothetical protein